MLVRRLIACLALSLSMAAHAGQIVVSDSLSTTDFLGKDKFGQFYYDAFDLTVTAPTAITLSMQAGAALEPFLLWWDHVVLPTFVWQDGAAIDLYADANDINSSFTPGALITLDSFVATPGISYQLAATTVGYLTAAGLDAYTLTVDYGTAPEGTVTLRQLHPVPEPATSALLGAGLLGFVYRRRQYCALRG